LDCRSSPREKKKTPWKEEERVDVSDLKVMAHLRDREGTNSLSSQAARRRGVRKGGIRAASTYVKKVGAVHLLNRRRSVITEKTSGRCQLGMTKWI